MADPLTYANSDEYVLVNPSDPKVGHLIYDAPMVDAETKQFIRDPETGKIKVYRMVIWGTKGLTQAQVEALITQKNATLVTRINNLDSTLTNFLDADDTSLDQLSELVAAIKANKIDIASLVTDIGKLIDPVSHLPIEATTASVGAVQLATATDIENGTANKVVDAKELINFAQTLPAVNGITDVSSGDNSNQLVVSRIGGSKTLTIDNVEHADSANQATHAATATTSDTAKYLGGVPEIVYGVNRLNYFNIYTDTTSGAANVANPYYDWFYHLVMNHANGNGYYFDIACALNQNAIYYRRIETGNEQGWVCLIDSGNIGSQSVNYANSAGNADTVDGSHAWQMQTLAADGSGHGSAWQMQCQHNVDGDGYFKLYCGDKSVGTKVDRASTAGWADSAGSANTVAWSNVSGRPDIWIG